MSKRAKRDERNLEAAKRIAKNLIAHRLWNHRSQTEMGDVIGVSFQQYQKMEKCQNRIYAEDLDVICKAMKWDITLMYSDPENMLLEWVSDAHPNSRVRSYIYDKIRDKWSKTEKMADIHYSRRIKAYNVMTNREE